MIDVEHLLAAPPRFHGCDGVTTDAWRLDDAALLFLAAQLRSGMQTIETGAGVSTIVFALTGVRHTCVVPDRKVVQRIQHFSREHDVSLRNIDFVVERSEFALPGLAACGYDVALIDGRHGFPAPFIDWFYISNRLRRGGVVLLDDTWIWTGKVLADFLDATPGWRRCAALPNSAAFVKECDGAEHAEWVEQPFVYEQSPAARFYPRMDETVSTQLSASDDGECERLRSRPSRS
jgi:predicted O-methyltransferase YrrM